MTSPHIRVPADPLLECPSCGLPAEIIDRFTLDAAPTPVEHIKLVCVNRHWYVLPVDRIRRCSADPAAHLNGVVATELLDRRPEPGV
jgi:hypothetical protein